MEILSKNLITSFSGGRTSAYMAKKIREDSRYKDCNFFFVFSNTGKELQATLDFVNQCDKNFGLNVVWLEPKIDPELGVGTTYNIVNYQTADREGKRFEEMIQKYGIPNQKFPHCTRELKQRPITAWARDMFGSDYVMAIGIRFDEIRRAKSNRYLIYPLLAMLTTVKDVRDFWNQQSFDLKLKDYEGNCDLCWKKSLRKKLTLLKENSAMADWWNRMEEKYSELQVEGRQKIQGEIFFNHGPESIKSLLLESKNPFTMITDPEYRSQINQRMDEEQSCNCMNQELGDDD